MPIRAEYGRALCAALCALCLLAGCAEKPQPIEPDETTGTVTATETTTTTTQYPAPPQPDAESITLMDTSLVRCRNAVLVAVEEGDDNVLAARGSQERVFPASLTKVMTLLTFFDLCPPDRLGDALLMTEKIRNLALSQGAACAGFETGEICRIDDLLYGMMLPSGAEAALALATFVSGSEEAFVTEMNRLAVEMGLNDTHFCNCTGLHDEAHYTTASDLAAILAYAITDPRCAALMSTEKHTTPVTAQHQNGIILRSTLFSRMTGQELTECGMQITVKGGKTGFTDEAGQCLATWGEDASGRQYICVVLGCDPKNPLEAVCDTLTLYQLTEKPYGEITRYLLPGMEETTVSAGQTAVTETTISTEGGA